MLPPRPTLQQLESGSLSPAMTCSHQAHVVTRVCRVYQCPGLSLCPCHSDACQQCSDSPLGQAGWPCLCGIIGHLETQGQAVSLPPVGPDTQTIITPEHVTEEGPTHSETCPQKLAGLKEAPWSGTQHLKLSGPRHSDHELLCPHSHDPGVSLNWLASKKGFASCLSSC